MKETRHEEVEVEGQKRAAADAENGGDGPNLVKMYCRRSDEDTT